MCGGVGSRFWPFSRGPMPKQFLDFFGSGRSLLQMAFDRIRQLIPPERILLMTNHMYADIVAQQLPEIPKSNVLCEPSRRNTAPCICWAAHHIARRDPDASMVVLASDHLILREDDFRCDIEEGLNYVETTGNLLTLGVKPSSPHTGYGYIQAGISCVDFPDILKVKSFTEKPDLEMARIFIESGEFYWNSGMFLWQAKSIIEAFKKHAPELEALFASAGKVYGTELEPAFIERVFESATSISIDYAIMEKASNVYMKPVDFGWSDLGSWKSLYENSPRNQDGNVTQNCRVLTNDCSGSIFAIDGDKIVVADGLHDYIVAERGNALLIYPIAKEQSLRKVVSIVRERFGEKFI